MINKTWLATSILTVAALGYLTCEFQNKDNIEIISVNGAGASFPAPLYQRWTYEYNKLFPKSQISYQSVGSGAGIKSFIAQTVDFSASDVAMKDSEIDQVLRGTKLLPMTAGSIVLAYNVPGIDHLRLSRDVYVDIILGKITNWNDVRIKGLNPGLAFPNLPINFVYRSDGSGTTGIFTKHLSAINEEYNKVVGEGKTVEWPIGIGAKGNEGISAQILQTEGSIGYIEFGYASLNKIPMASLENKEGFFVQPTFKSASETLAQVVLPENLRAFITDPDGESSYPIVSYSWILMYKNGYTEEMEHTLKEFFIWTLTDGQEYSEELGYILLPDSVVKEVLDKLLVDENN